MWKTPAAESRVGFEDDPLEAFGEGPLVRAGDRRRDLVEPLERRASRDPADDFADLEREASFLHEAPPRARGDDETVRDGDTALLEAREVARLGTRLGVARRIVERDDGGTGRSCHGYTRGYDTAVHRKDALEERFGWGTRTRRVVST